MKKYSLSGKYNAFFYSHIKRKLLSINKYFPVTNCKHRFQRGFTGDVPIKIIFVRFWVKNGILFSNRNQHSKR